jgi:WD40 repeat protein
MVRVRYFVFCLLFAVLPAAHSFAVESCPALVVPQFLPGTNMFNPQQEVWLGDAQAAVIEQSVNIVQDKALTAYLQGIVDELATPLPPDHIPFRVKLIETPTAEAFSIAGGHIYVSRKLIAMSRSQDELAGVLAHEMGHIIAHHAALTASQDFRKVLGVNQVSDRDDVTARWNELLSNYRRQKLTSSEKWYEIEEKEQVQADMVALYLVTRAGYAPQSFQSFFDRLAETKGNAGGFWSDLFGTTKPDSRRLGKIIKDTPKMPANCIAPQPDNAAKFEHWKTGVIEYSDLSASREESVSGLVSKRVLTERLRPEIQDIRISPDGKYVLAQDDSNAFILERHPLKPVFRFEALEATPGQFTPDSRGVVLLFDAVGASPRVERWSIQTQKRLEVHEIYVKDGCLLSKVAPDGKTLACLTKELDSSGFLKFNLDLYDVAAGTSFYHKKGWVEIDLVKMFLFGGWKELPEFWAAGQKLLEALSPMAFSPDGHYFVAQTRQNFLAMDAVAHQPFNVPGNIKSLTEYSFAFVGNDRLVGIAGGSGDKSAVVEFPSGKVIYKDLSIGGSHVQAAAHGDLVLLRPIKDHPVGIFDFKKNRIILASKRSAIDVWDDQYIAEKLDGDLQVFDLGTVKALEHAQLPDAPLGTVRADAISSDLNWLAISQKTRGAVWNLQTGQRVYHLRGFSAAYFGPDEGLYADFPKYLTTDRTLARAALKNPDIQSEKTIDENKHTVQVGRYLLTVVPAKENNTSTNVSLELWDVIDQKVVWTKQFPHERPGYHVDARANSLVLYWLAGSQSAKTIAKDDPAAAAAIARFKDKDSALFAQVLDLNTGKVRAQVTFDTGKHSFQVVEAMATADQLVIADDKNRVLVYSFDGQLKGTIAGHSPSVSAKADLLTVKIESGELELYDLATMQKRSTYNFQNRVAFNGFSDDGKRLLVLTGDQVVYVLDPAGKPAMDKVASK